MRAKDLKEGVEYVYRDYGALLNYVTVVKVGKFRSLCNWDINRIAYKWNHRIEMSHKDYRKILCGGDE